MGESSTPPTAGIWIRKTMLGASVDNATPTTWEDAKKKKSFYMSRWITRSPEKWVPQSRSKNETNYLMS